MLAEAASTLRTGGLVAFPTETVYGLGADATDPTAVGRVFAAKGRPADNPLIVHLADAADLDRVAARVPPLAAELARRFWPGPLTLVLEAGDHLPAETTGGHATVGVRVPDHPVARALLAAADRPVAAPSANRSGRPSPTTAAHVMADLGDVVDVIVDGGACVVGVESTVVDARGPRPVVLREGAVTREDLGVDGGASDAASPGTRYRHYAPRCQVLLAEGADAATTAAALSGGGARVAVVLPEEAAAPPGVKVVGRFGDPAALARDLYDALRRAEDAGADHVVVATVEEVGIGRAVMDRLRRAAAA